MSKTSTQNDSYRSSGCRKGPTTKPAIGERERNVGEEKRKIKSQTDLETVDLDSSLVDFQSRGQKVLNFLSLVTLKLKNFTKFFVLVDVAVASKIFLESLQDSLQIILCWNTLDSSDSLSTITLLATDMDVVGRLCVIFPGIGKGI